MSILNTNLLHIIIILMGDSRVVISVIVGILLFSGIGFEQIAFSQIPPGGGGGGGLVKGIEIDIKPGSDPNAIQPFNMGLVPVVILSSNTFSASTVDFSTVIFGPDEANPVHKKPHFEDVNNDGLEDMVLHFKTKEIGIEENTIQLCLTAKTLGGTVTVIGCDSIIVVPKN